MTLRRIQLGQIEQSGDKTTNGYIMRVKIQLRVLIILHTELQLFHLIYFKRSLYLHYGWQLSNQMQAQRGITERRTNKLTGHVETKFKEKPGFSNRKAPFPEITSTKMIVGLSVQKTNTVLRLILLLCLYGKTEATASSRVAQLSISFIKSLE